MRYLLLALFLSSSASAAVITQTGISGVNMSGYVVSADSQPVADIDISSAVYNGVSTVTVTMRGSRPALVIASGLVANASGSDRTYTCGIYQNGNNIDTAYGYAFSTTRPTGAYDLPVAVTQRISSTPSGVVNYALICKSSISGSGQLLRNVHLEVFEY